ncbi:MAG TPA: hypothetical protein VML75_25220 [Kofleriaceae bacterium]|nr:hypothetical protein [Kofleriaceae bacterium]
MGSEQFVNVSYRGIDVGAALKMIEFGPTTAYLELTTPMPVGTTLEVETDGGLSLRATVLRIQEQVAGAEMPPGMRVRAIDLGADASAWWKSSVTTTDPVIPEPCLQLAAEPAPAPPAVATPAPEPQPEPAPAPQPEAPTADDRQPRSTQIMDVSEIQAAIAAGGDVADLADAVPTEMDAQPTDPVPAPGANGDSSQDDSGGDKKKRKRRRRK